MPFKLYHFYLCPYCKPLYYFVNTNKLGFEEIHLDLSKGEQRTPEYLKINPFGKVPAIIEEDNFILFESSTILRYLCNTRDVPDHWYSKDPRKRSQVDLFFDWFQVATKAFIKYFYARHPREGSPSPSDIGTAKTELENTLKELEKNFLRDRKFLAGDEISIADIQIIFFFGQLEVLEFDLSNFSNLKDWRERVLSSGIKPNYEDFNEGVKKRIAGSKAAAENKEVKS